MFYLTRPRKEQNAAPEALVYQEHERAHLYVYVPNTGKFHRNDPMTTDFFFDHEVLTFEPVEENIARQMIKADLGRIDRRKHDWLVREYEQDSQAIEPTQIMPEKDAPLPVLSPRQHAKHMLDLALQAKPGTWITYRTYPVAKKQTAQAAAHDLRIGKVKSLAQLDLETRVVAQRGSEDVVEVQITRAR